VRQGGRFRFLARVPAKRKRVCTGPHLIERLHSLEAEILPEPVYSFADLEAKARVAETYAEADEAPAEVVAALVAGIEALARAAPMAMIALENGRAQP
jgi:hypothetical protein